LAAAEWAGVQIDSDGDGLDDAVDIDDDNDGIKDDDEMISGALSATIWNTAQYASAAPKVVGTLAVGSTTFNVVLTSSSHGTGQGTASDTNWPGLASSDGVPGMTDSSWNTTSNGVQIFGDNNAVTHTLTITDQFGNPAQVVNPVFTLSFVDGTSTYQISELAGTTGRITVLDSNNATLTAPGDTITVASTGTTEDSGGAFQVTGAFSTITLVMTRPTTNATDVLGFGTAALNLDSDGDGRINSRDIDSDNDGITDTIEAQVNGGNITLSGTDADNDGIDDAFIVPDRVPELVTNGNFSGGQTGWTLVSGAGVEFITTGNSFVRFGVANGAAGGTIEQVVTTEVGETYEMSFDFTAAGVIGNTGTASLLFEALDGSAAVIQSLAVSESPLDNTLARHKIRFVATETSTTLRFSDTSPDTVDIDPWLTNVSLLEVGLKPVDTDGDGILDVRDLDSDNDGILDNVEAQASGSFARPTGNDADNDGLDDAYDGANTLAVVDTDSDGVRDYRDIDSDNDGITDNVEAQASNAYVAPAGSDSDGDGVDNAYANANLIANGDFGNGTTGWSLTNAPAVNIVDIGGNGLARFGEGGLGAAGVLEQTVTTKADQAYELSFDFTAGATLGAPGQAGLRVEAVDGANNVIKTIDVTEQRVDNSFSRYYLRFVAAGANTKVRFADISPDTINVDVWLDNVSMRQLGVKPQNSDGDGVADYRDSDSDNDGTNDIAERGDGGPTTNPSFEDADGDGLDDNFEGANANRDICDRQSGTCCGARRECGSFQ